MPLTRPLATLALLICVIGSAAPAQSCVTPDDGLDLGCCLPANPVLPVFPPTAMPVSYARLTGCTASTSNAFIQFNPPNFLLSDFALIPMNCFFGNGDNISGTLFAKYSRTWIDLTTPGVSGQVWRFLVNGDLNCTPGLPGNACTSLLPACTFQPGNPNVHFDGHIDYSCDPSTPGNYFVSFSLNHLSGCISHAPWSCRPMTGTNGHVQASYHLVGPAPFNFGTGGGAFTGSILADAVRTSYLRLIPGFAYQSFSEEKTDPLVSGIAFSSPAGCLCATVNPCTSLSIPCLAPGCYENQILGGRTCCPAPPSGIFQSLAIAGTPVAATGLIALKLGTWGSLGHYPWSGDLGTYFGVMNYSDQCGHANWGIHVVTGVQVSNITAQPYPSTSGSFCSLVGLFSRGVLDLQNVLPLNNIPFLSPGYGCLSACDVVWNLNVL